MTWNHRVIRHVESDNEWYAIHDVYYDENDEPDGVTLDPEAVIGDNLEDLQQTLEWMTKALSAPILDYNMFLDQEKIN
mgnify:CR=1 FL=1